MVLERVGRGEKMQDCVSSNKIKENKYKILRMSLLLGRGENPEETLTNFEEAARDIDAMNDETYIKDLEGKFYDTLTLEEEEKKLAVLVDYIGGRVEQRISLLNDFSNVTGYDLSNLPPIKYYDKLDDYKERLKYIREYLTNITEIEKLNEVIEKSEKDLKEAYLNRATAEDYNARNEEILLNKFENLLKSTNLKDIDKNNIEDKLSSVLVVVEDSKKSLDIFNRSFATLSGSGISYEEEQEYKSYVENAKDAYYANKEQEYLLRLYVYLLKIETTYSSILEKRENINAILQERIQLRRDLEVKDNDILGNLYDLLDRQFEDIVHQKDNIELIERLTKEIENAKNSLNELELDNQKVEILALLREFCLIDTYSDTYHDKKGEFNVGQEQKKKIEEDQEKSNVENNEKIVSDDNNHSLFVSDKPLEDGDEKNPSSHSDIFMNANLDDKNQSNLKVEEGVLDIQEAKDNQVISVEDSVNIDLDYIHSKASKVMQRVGEMLGIKVKDTKIVSVEVPKVETAKDDTLEKTTVFHASSGDESSKINLENPLFNSNLEKEKDIFAKEEKKTDSTLANDDFWFPSDSPDALNELPDLDVPSASANNNFFGNNQMPNLNFPDLNLSFSPNGEEEKQ